MISESTVELLFDQQPSHHTSHIYLEMGKRTDIQSIPISISFIISLNRTTRQREMKRFLCSIAMALIFSCLVQQSSAQNSACMQRLLPCMDYLNGTRDPPRSCCDPLKYVIKSEPECLCQMISIKGANQAEQAGINLTDAQQLPGKCGQHIDPLGCILGSPGSRSASFSFKYPSRILTATSLMMAIVQVLWTFLNPLLMSSREKA